MYIHCCKMSIYHDNQILSDSESDHDDYLEVDACGDHDGLYDEYDEYDIDNLLYRHDPEKKEEFSYSDIILFTVAIMLLWY